MSEKILILEDDDKLRLTLSQVLQGEGYRVDEAANGSEAIRLAAQGGYDLVIADIRMEGVDGLEALARMKERHPEMRSLVMTGYSTEEDSIRAIRLGVGDYLRKPFRFEELMDSVQRLLALRRQEVQQAAQAALMRRSMLRASQATARSLDLMGAPGRPKAGLLSVLPLAERLARARGLSAEASETVQLGACMLALNRCDGEAGALVDEDELPPSLRLCLQPGLEPTLEARIVYFAVAQAYEENPQDLELSELLAGEVEENPAGGQQMRSLLSLGQALEAAGQSAEARHAYEQICAGSAASREWVQAALGLVRLESKTKLLAERARRAVEAAQAVGPGVSAQAFFECGLLLLQRAQAGGENLLLQAGRLYRELNFPSYQALATLAVAALGTQAIAEEASNAALELLGRPEYREEVLRHQNWLAPWLLNSAAANGQRILQRWLQDGSGSLARSLQQGRFTAAARASLLEGLKKAPAPPAALAELLAKDSDEGLRAEAASLLPAAAPGAPSEVRILTLGPLEVFRGQERVPNSAWRSQKGRFLLAFLAVQAGKPVSEDVLIDMFWPEDADKGKRSLYWVTSMIRNCLRGPDEVDPIVRHQGMLALNPQLPRWHDLEQLEELTRAPGGDKADAWRRGVALYRGPFLEGCYMDWAEPVRLRAFSTVCEALLKLAQWAQQAGRPAESLEHARRLWELDPCRQDACLLAMQALQALSRAEEAVRFFERCKKALHRELEMEPGVPLLEAQQRALMSLSS